MHVPPSCGSPHKVNTIHHHTHAINGPNMLERQSTATTTLEDRIFTQLKIANTLGELQVDAEKISVLICLDATSLWHLAVTKIYVFVNS